MALKKLNKSTVQGYYQSDSLVAKFIESGQLELLIRPESIQVIKATKSKSVGLNQIRKGELAELILVKGEKDNKFDRAIQRMLLLIRWRRRFKTLLACADAELPVAQLWAVFLQKHNQRYTLYSIYEGIPASDNLANIAKRRRDYFESLLDQGLMERVVDTLVLMHSHGFIHRDLKWSNVLVFDNGEIKWVDTDHISQLKALPLKPIFIRDFARFIVGAYEANVQRDLIQQLIKQYVQQMGWNLSYVNPILTKRINKLLFRKNLTQEHGAAI